MNTIRCLECNKLLPGSASYCSSCGVSTFRMVSSRLDRMPLWDNEGVLQEEPSNEWQAIRRPATWHKDVAPLPNRAAITPLPPRPARVRPPMWNTWRRIFYRIPPGVFVWISLLIFLSLVFGGASGLVVTLGRSAKTEVAHPTMLSLQVTPSNIAVGATVMLEGKNFTPHGKIGLMRDAAIPVLDTANMTLIDADSHGDFTDTIAITPEWEAGAHTLDAEDAFKHKVASFSILVTGHATSLRPAHLLVAEDTLDLGVGDQATSTSKTITLTNIGGGTISWQGNCAQPWIAFSPSSGTIASNHSVQIIVSIDRTELGIGSYSAQLNIFSNGGNGSVSIKSLVTASSPVQQRTSLQASPSALSFTAIDGDPSPATQVIMVSNFGPHPLQWQATTSANWLSISPQSTIIQPSDSQMITVGVINGLLMPGTYESTITLSALGSNGVAGSTQTLFVSITIVPQCSLQVTPGQLSFTSIYQQAIPAVQTLNIGNSQSCNAHIGWHAISTASWLHVDVTDGHTPANTKIGVNISALPPGTYSGSIIFSSLAGTQTLPVNLAVKTPCTFSVTPTILNVTSIIGQAASIVQRQVALFPSSSCIHPLNWSTAVATSNGGNWLSASSTGSATVVNNGAITVNSTLTNLVVGNYTGTLIITTTDSVTAQAIGTPQVVQVNLTIQPTCTLQAPSAIQKSFVATAGSKPASQSFTIAATGACPGTTTIVPQVIFTSGSNWLAIVASTTTLAGGENATFTVNVSTIGLAAGTYKASILLNGLNDSIAMANSSQQVEVTLTIGILSSPLATPTPTAVPTPTPTPTPTDTPTPTPDSITPTPSPVSSPVPTAT